MPDAVPDSLPAITPPASPEYHSPNVGRSASGGLSKSSSAPVLKKSSPLSDAAKRRLEEQQERKNQFLQRQFQHSSLGPRRNMSLLQRDVVKNGRASDDVEFWGAKGKDGFVTYLEKKFGNMVNGWRALDRDGSGRLSFHEFCNACRAMGYHGNLKKLWKELDVNNNGCVSLMEIDAEVGYYVGTFKRALLRKYGDMLTAWLKCIDINRNGRIEEYEISSALGELGLTDLDPKKLFKMLTISWNKSVGLSLHDFDPDSWSKYIAGDHANLVMRDNVEFLDDLPLEAGESVDDLVGGSKSGGVQQRRLHEVKAGIDERKQILERIEKMKVGLHTPDGFKQALVGRCGSLLSAWREALDLDGNGRLTFGEFCLALSRLGYHGNVRGLWQQLTGSRDESGHLLFSQLDPETNDSVNELRELLEKEYENMLMAWVKGLDTRGNGLVTEKQFVDCCAKVGFSKDAKHLFKVMQPDPGRTLMTIRDFDTKAFNAMSRGDYRMLSEPGQGYVGKSPLQMTFHERNEAGFFFQIRRAWEAARQQEFAKACRMNQQEHIIDTVEEFEELCVRKFGSMIGAWRNCLDDDVNGKLTFGEFCTALRRIGYAGDFKSLYKSYDKDNKGHISLRDLCPEEDEIVNSFLKLLGETFKTIELAWRDGFHQDPHGSISKKDLAEACSKLGYPYDMEKLFKCLQPSPGKQLITIWDLDPECSRMRARGLHHHEIIKSEPRSLDTSPLEKKHFSVRLSVMPPSKEIGKMLSESMRSSFTEKSFHTFSSPTPLQQLRLSLKVTYGSTVAAWRNVLDPQLQGGCGFGKLMVALEDCAYAGNKKQLWDELCKGQPSIQFADIDFEASRLLDGFREQLLEAKGTLLQAWHDGLDTDGSGRLDEEHFVKGLQSLGIVVKNPKKLFRLLLARHGQRSLILEDFQALLIGVPSSERAPVWAPRPAAAGATNKESAAAKIKNAPDAIEIPTTPSMSQRSFYGGELSPKQHAELVVSEHHAGDIIIKTVPDFKQMLVTKYGSLFGAWRHGLDADQNGVVTQNDFSAACNSLGVKAIRTLWNELDVNKNGQISLYEIDPEVAEPFAELENLMIEKYGSTKTAWAATFNKDKSLRCDQQKFRAVLEELGFSGDADRFFKLLKPEPGRPYLAYEDLWLNRDMNNFRKPGDEPSGSPLGTQSPLASISRTQSPTGTTAAERRSGMLSA